MQILLLEDDPELGQFVQQGLERLGHVIDVLRNGRDALTAALSNDYDVIVLDRMVPELDGLSVLRSLRSAKVNTPVLMLTAMSTVEARVDGLEAGADDYLVKPFAMTELSARIGALCRRGRTVDDPTSTVLTAGGIELDRMGQHCSRNKQSIVLSAIEFRLLETFMLHPGRVMTKNMLLERVWNIDYDPTTSVVETHISRLRAKIDKPFDSNVITTLRGAGYRFDA